MHLVSEDDIPHEFRKQLSDYILYGSQPDSLLRAVLSNDLQALLQIADDTPWPVYGVNTVVKWLNRHAPVACFGSKKRVAGWRRQNGLAGCRKEFRELFTQQKEQEEDEPKAEELLTHKATINADGSVVVTYLNPSGSKMKKLTLRLPKLSISED